MVKELKIRQNSPIIIGDPWGDGEPGRGSINIDWRK